MREYPPAKKIERCWCHAPIDYSMRPAVQQLVSYTNFRAHQAKPSLPQHPACQSVKFRQVFESVMMIKWNYSGAYTSIHITFQSCLTLLQPWWACDWTRNGCWKRVGCFSSNLWSLWSVHNWMCQTFVWAVIWRSCTFIYYNCNKKQMNCVIIDLSFNYYSFMSIGYSAVSRVVNSKPFLFFKSQKWI